MKIEINTEKNFRAVLSILEAYSDDFMWKNGLKPAAKGDIEIKQNTCLKIEEGCSKNVKLLSLVESKERDCIDFQVRDHPKRMLSYWVEWDIKSPTNPKKWQQPLKKVKNAAEAGSILTAGDRVVVHSSTDQLVRGTVYETKNNDGVAKVLELELKLKYCEKNHDTARESQFLYALKHSLLRDDNFFNDEAVEFFKHYNVYKVVSSGSNYDLTYEELKDKAYSAEEDTTNIKTPKTTYEHTPNQDKDSIDFSEVEPYSHQELIELAPIKATCLIQNLRGNEYSIHEIEGEIKVNKSNSKVYFKHDSPEIYSNIIKMHSASSHPNQYKQWIWYGATSTKVMITNLEDYSFKNNIMSNLIAKFKELTLSEPSKSFRKAGIENENGAFTQSGQELFLEWLKEKYGDEFKEEVVDQLLEDEE